MGGSLIALAIGVLLIDQGLAPWYPFLFLVVLSLTLVACYEVVQLLPPDRRPREGLCYVGVAGLMLANWVPHIAAVQVPDWAGDPDPWHWIAGVFATIVLATFLLEMAAFQGPGESVTRMALTVWIVAYLGLLPSFLAQLRWLGGSKATMALALAIFVPKAGDMGAYFTGRLLGRHRMAPVLSPKKTWEGVAGGFVAAIAVAIGIDWQNRAVPSRLVPTAVLGIVLCIAGMVGDLAESLIKRDCGKKDASQVVPGFGGVLDIVDAIVFAAPAAYWFLK
jgi:phosphatidate cytidylyltransferase